MLPIFSDFLLIRPIGFSVPKGGEMLPNFLFWLIPFIETSGKCCPIFPRKMPLWPIRFFGSKRGGNAAHFLYEKNDVSFYLATGGHAAQFCPRFFAHAVLASKIRGNAAQIFFAHAVLGSKGGGNAAHFFCFLFLARSTHRIALETAEMLPNFVQENACPFDPSTFWFRDTAECCRIFSWHLFARSTYRSRGKNCPILTKINLAHSTRLQNSGNAVIFCSWG